MARWLTGWNTSPTNNIARTSQARKLRGCGRERHTSTNERYSVAMASQVLVINDQGFSESGAGEILSRRSRSRTAFHDF
jgi:hypothetical protein